MNILNYLRVSRIQTLFMTLSQILCAYAYINHHYSITNVKCFALVSISIIFFHIATNTLSEYRDCKKGVDDVHSPHTKYRLASGIVPKKHVLIIGITSFIMASITGVFSLFIGTIYLLVPGITAACIAFFYSEKPLCLKYRALGEVCVFLIYGPLLFSSLILSQTYSIDLKDVAFSIPFGLLTTCVLLANNIRDYEYEKGKTITIPIKFGLKISYIILFSLVHIAYLITILLVFKNVLPYAAFSTFLIYPLIFLSIKHFDTPWFVNIFGILNVAYGIFVSFSLFLQS